MKKIIAVFILFTFLSCQEKINVNLSEDVKEINEAVAVLQSLNDSKVSGIVYINEGEGFVEIIADIYGLSRGNHGIHIHEYGDLRSNSGDYLGGHYNPTDGKHGGNSDDGSHLGDLGNIYAVDDSTAQFKQKFFGLSIDGVNSILGRSIVIHQNEDDFTTQPSGNSGKRIAAGIIAIKNSEAY